MMTTLARPWSIALVLALGCLGGACSSSLQDPYRREGTWNPTGVNEANIAAMVANPRDLVIGVNDPVSPAQLSAAAVNRLLTNTVKPLQETDIGRVGGSGGGAGAGAAAGAAQ